MKLSTLSLVILSSVTLSAASMATTNLTPSSAQLVHLPAPSTAIEKQPVHFSQAMKSSLLANHSFESLSDEYWIEVDGQTLNQGIGLSITQPEALIRLSAKQSIGHNLPDDHAIDPQQLELRKDKQLIDKAFSQRVSQEQMATASILANSSAVKMSAAAGTGQFKLRVAQQLAPTQKYIVNVKEKGSAYRQSLATDQQTYLAGAKVRFSASVMKQTQALENTAHRAFIKAPNGEINEVAYAAVGDEYQIELPTDVHNATRGQLYELHVESQVTDGANKVMRHGKMAFSVAAPTARMSIEGASYERASFNLEVASEGRYAVSGVIYGYDQSGQAQPMMQSSSAYYLSPGQQTVELEFDQNIFNASTLSAPFVLRDAKLVDQSRVSVLQRQSSQQKVVLAEPEPEVKSSGGSMSVISLLGIIGLGGLIRRRRV